MWQRDSSSPLTLVRVGCAKVTSGAALIARDLHNDISRQLAAPSIALSGIRRRVEGVPDGQGLRIGVSSVSPRHGRTAEGLGLISINGRVRRRA